MTDTATRSADAEPISKALVLLHKGSSLPAILGTLVKVPTADPPALADEMPKTVLVTTKITEAVNTLGLLTNGHQHLTVAERRPLTQDELDTLSAERDAIDTLEKYIKGRKEAHKIMLYNHWDAEIDQSDGPKPPIDDKGRYLTKVSAFAQGSARHFDRQLAEGAPYVTEDALKEVAQSGKVEGFGHKEYLACTSEVRVIDEAKILIQMRKGQSVVAALREATQMGAGSSSFYHRAS